MRWSSKSSAASVGIAGTVGGEETQNSQGVRLQIALVLGSLVSSLKRSSFLSRKLKAQRSFSSTSKPLGCGKKVEGYCERISNHDQAQRKQKNPCMYLIKY